METEYINCNLCGRDNSRVLFKGEDRTWLVKGQFSLVKCSYCGLIYINPRPTLKEMGRFYPTRYFSRVFEAKRMSKKQFLKMRKVFENRYRPFLKYKKTGNLLEIGCSDGYFLRFLKDKGWNVLGIEPSVFASQFAREVLSLDILTGTLEDFDLKNGSFDVVCMFEVFEHLHNPLSSLVKIKEILKKGGILVITVPNFSSFGRIIFGRSWLNIDIPRHLFYFTEKTITGMLVKAGFEPLILFTASNINYPHVSWGYSESLRLWLREHKIYYSREYIIKHLLSHIERGNFDKRLNYPKAVLHKMEQVLLSPIACLMDMIHLGENLYICAQRRY